MTERDGFGSGFLVGTVVGSILGGVVGAIVASRQNQTTSPETHSLSEDEEGMETARRSLEDKISQLNLAIDDVRQQLGETGQNPTQD